MRAAPAKLPLPTPDFKKAKPNPLGDLRFRNLLTSQEWEHLPTAIRRRFSKRLTGGATAIYVGTIDRVHSTLTGRFFIQMCRFIGAPLPMYRDTGVTAIVSVTEDIATGGQIWTRLYARRSGFPQIIQSSKRFSGPTGLEEYIGYGIAMALRPKANATSLNFQSAGYRLIIGKMRIPLPGIFSPGIVTVSHEEVTSETFRFTLKLEHPKFGVLLEQSGVFHEEEAV